MANKKYQIWDEISPIIVPTGNVYTADEWKDKYPMAKLDGLNLVISGGTINGAFCTEYTSFVDMYEKMGCDFSNCESQQDYLDAIEAYEDAMNQPKETEVTPEERIAAALEFQTMMMLPDDEEE